MLKVSYGTSLKISLHKADGTVKDFNSVYCNKCSQNSETKTYKDIVSTTNLAQHFECLTENADMENARRSKSDTGKPETDTHYRTESTFNRNM